MYFQSGILLYYWLVFIKWRKTEIWKNHIFIVSEYILNCVLVKFYLALILLSHFKFFMINIEILLDTEK